MKNIILLITSLIFSIILIYFLLFTWVVAGKKYISNHNFSDKETLKFHKHYSDKLHHLRGKHFKDKHINKEDYMFTIISEYTQNKINFLIQGDSWAEYLITKEITKKKLDEIAKKKNIGIINSGISSFSPTPMSIQLKILSKDFNINPDIVISFIDQTDIGDEICRYKSKIYRNKDNQIIGIKKELNTGAVFDYSKYYRFSEIINDKKRLEGFLITNYYIEKFFKEFLHRIKNLNNKSYLCKFDDISRYLYDLKIENRKYFQDILENYISSLNNTENIKKIYLISFPHYNHLNKKYKVNMSDIIDTLDLPKKIKHINFSKIIDNNNFLGTDLYIPNDKASHLNEKTQTKVIEYIIDYILEKNVNDLKS